MRTRTRSFAVPAAVLFVVGVPLAAQAAPTPPSESSAVAAKAGDLLSVSATNAKAATDTGTSDVVQFQVAPWEAAAKVGQEERTARSRASLVRVHALGNGHVYVLDSESKASHKSRKSTGFGSSDGARLIFGPLLDVVVLHSEVSSENQASSYLLGLNGTEIGSDEQFGAGCALPSNPSSNWPASSPKAAKPTTTANPP
jgi:hypothetical protein